VIGGAGLLGSTSAFVAAAQGLADEIVLYDARENYARNHAIDLDQGVCEISPTRTVAGGFEELEDCDILLNTAGAPERNAASRDVYLEDNIQIIRSIADQMSAWAKISVVISASNPIDVLNYKLCEFIGGPPSKFVGYSKNDTLRLKWSVAQETGIPAALIDAIVLGEHGEYQVPVFSSLKRKDTGEPIRLTETQRERVKGTIRNQFKRLTAFGQR
jgi:malate/lactate dehydrogenase